MSDDGGAERADAAIVGWFRIDQSREITRLLIRSALLLLGGSLLVAGFWATERSATSWRWMFGMGGALLCVVGPLGALLGLRKILSEDAYVALRTDGLFVSNATREGGERLIGWDDFVEAKEDVRSGAIVLVMRDETLFTLDRPLAGIDARALVKHLLQTRRRVLMGIGSA